MLPLKDDQPSYSTPFVNWFLIALNILVFLCELQLSRAGLKQLFDQFALVPANVWNPHYNFAQIILPFFTAMFSASRLGACAGQHVVPVDFRGQR